MRKKFVVTGVVLTAALTVAGTALAATTPALQSVGADVTSKISAFGKRLELTEEQKAERLAALKEKLAKAVADGQLTQAEADEKYAKAAEGGLLFRFDKEHAPPALTEEQKADMLANLKKELDAQVTAGNMTQAQADERYKQAQDGDRFFMHHEKGAPPALTDEQKAEMLATLKTSLDAQVAAGNMTQAQADEHYKQAQDGDRFFMHHEKGAPPALTDEQKADMLATLKQELDAQVAAGNLTQAQADTMYKAAQEGKRMMFKLHRGGPRPTTDTSTAPQQMTPTAVVAQTV